MKAKLRVDDKHQELWIAYAVNKLSGHHKLVHKIWTEPPAAHANNYVGAIVSQSAHEVKYEAGDWGHLPSMPTMPYRTAEGDMTRITTKSQSDWWLVIYRFQPMA